MTAAQEPRTGAQGCCGTCGAPTEVIRSWLGVQARWEICSADRDHDVRGPAPLHIATVSRRRRSQGRVWTTGLVA